MTMRMALVPKSMAAMIRVGGKTYRLLGPPPVGAPAMEQKSVTVRPTQTICEFEGQGVGVTLTFTSPLLPDDLEVLARPVTYVTVRVKPLAQAADGDGLHGGKITCFTLRVRRGHTRAPQAPPQ